GGDTLVQAPAVGRARDPGGRAHDVHAEAERALEHTVQRQVGDHLARLDRNVAIRPLAGPGRPREGSDVQRSEPQHPKPQHPKPQHPGPQHPDPQHPEPRHPLDDDLADFARRSITLDGTPRTVYVGGSGPAVIVMAEMPGISPDVARFARWVRDAGLTVYLPSLFGRDGAYPDAEAGRTIMKRACVSAEFRAFGAGRSSPIAVWLRALAALAHRECGGPGVGALGMCFTGNFALTMMLEPAVLAPVLCQPSLPLD